MAVAKPLLLKIFRDHWRGYSGWSIGMLAIVSIQLSVYPTVRSSAAGLASFIENYPEALRKIFRMEDYTSGAGYLSSELFSFMVPLIFIAIGASWGGSASAQEEEQRTADLLLTLPISRGRILGTKILAAVSAQIVLAAVLFFGLMLGIRAVDISIGSSRILAGSISCALLGILYNSVSTFLGAMWGKRSIALGGGIALAIAGFLFYSLAPLVHTFDKIASINPFQWTLGSDPIRRGIDVGYTILCLLVAVAFYFAGVIAFNRRDISS
jgi:ABC-2 type transport system permease protein